jgi:hypothetical protein
MYVVADKRTANVMGEFSSLVQARTYFLDLVAAHPPVAPDLVILSKNGNEQSVPEDEVREAVARGPAHAVLS